MATTIQEIIANYWEDKWYQEKYAPKRTQDRNNALPEITKITRKFVDGNIDLLTYRKRLDKTFVDTEENWGAKSHGLLIPLNRIIKTHDETTATYLRELLTDLSVENLGLKIEQFHKFLQEKRDRLRQEGKPSWASVEAGKSAFIISLFAFWLLSPEQQPIVYHIGVRSGLAILIKKQLFLPPQSPPIEGNVVTITTASDHQIMLQALEKLLTIDPSLRKYDPYWAEFFLFWVMNTYSRSSKKARN